jgi:NADPH-dependent 2,4-dienoyl-CoA reductase/sulfur reductase-like enzyme
MRRAWSRGLRVNAHPLLPAAQVEEVTFEFEGRRLRGRRGEAISSALLANGYSVLSRSVKYHRPRGLTCFSSACPNCAMSIDGLPGTPACGTTLSGDEVVRRERAWPSAEFDVLGFIDRLSWLVPAGFQFRWFAHSSRVGHLAERVMATASGGGRMPTSEAAGRARTGLLGSREVDVAVVGGGAAGLAAALAAAGEGANVALVERRGQLGGALLQETRLLEHEGLPSIRAFALAGELAAEAMAHPRISTFLSSAAIGWYEGNVLPVVTRDGVLALASRRIVVASGTHEEPILFQNSDRPGVMFASAAQRLINVDRVRPGRRAVVVTNEPYGYAVAAQLLEVGVEVSAVVDSRDYSASQADRERVGLSVAIHEESYPFRAHGGRRIRALTIRSSSKPGQSRRLSCDVVVLAGGRKPADEIALQVAYEGSILLEPVGGLGAASTLERRRQRGSLEALWLAGGTGGAETLEDALVDGAEVGRAAATEL